MMKMFFALLTLALYSCNQPEKAAIAPEPVTAVVKEEVKIISPYVGDWIGESDNQRMDYDDAPIDKKTLRWQFSLKKEGSFLLKISGDSLAQEDVIRGQWATEEGYIILYPSKAGVHFFPYATDNNIPLEERIGYFFPVEPLAEGYMFYFGCCDQFGKDHYVCAKRPLEGGK